MTTALDLAKLVEAAMKQQGLTRLLLKDKAGISRTALYRLMKGEDVQVSTLLAVLDVLQLDLAGLPRGIARGLPELVTAQISDPDQPATFNRARWEAYAKQKVPLDTIVSRVQANAAKLFPAQFKTTITSTEPLKANLPLVFQGTASVPAGNAANPTAPRIEAPPADPAQPAAEGDASAPSSKEDGTP